MGYIEFGSLFLDKGKHTVGFLKHGAYYCNIIRVFCCPKQRFMSLGNLRIVYIEHFKTPINCGELLILFHIFMQVGVLHKRIHEFDCFQYFIEIPGAIEDPKFCRSYLFNRT